MTEERYPHGRFGTPEMPEAVRRAARRLTKTLDLGEDLDDYATLREIQGRADKPETIVHAVDEQREYGAKRRTNYVERLKARNADLEASLARAADATVRAYEPPDTLTGVAFAAVEGLLATGKRWWRG